MCDKTMYRGEQESPLSAEELLRKKREGKSMNFRIVESIPDPKGCVIIGIKEDPNGPCASRNEALNHIRERRKNANITSDGSLIGDYVR